MTEAQGSKALKEELLLVLNYDFGNSVTDLASLGSSETEFRGLFYSVRMQNSGRDTPNRRLIAMKFNYGYVTCRIPNGFVHVREQMIRSNSSLIRNRRPGFR